MLLKPHCGASGTPCVQGAKLSVGLAQSICSAACKQQEALCCPSGRKAHLHVEEDGVLLDVLLYLLCDT